VKSLAVKIATIASAAALMGAVVAVPAQAGYGGACKQAQAAQ
jgi:hypothetical protein